MDIQIDESGWLNQASHIESPNCDDRPENLTVELLVIHNISLPPGEFGGNGVHELFTNRLDPTVHPYYETIKELRVSAHFLIRRDGELIQFVSTEKRAWHAGASSWQERERCNDFSIGIELEGTDQTPFTDAQYASLNELVKVLRSRYPIRDIVGHADIAPGRKTDPGLCFDWKKLDKGGQAA